MTLQIVLELATKQGASRDFHKPDLREKKLLPINEYTCFRKNIIREERLSEQLLIGKCTRKFRYDDGEVIEAIIPG